MLKPYIRDKHPTSQRGHNINKIFREKIKEKILDLEKFKNQGILFEGEPSTCTCTTVKLFFREYGIVFLL